VEVGEMPTIQADPMQMHQLFQNLIGNALKFHRPEIPPLVKLSYECTADGKWVIVNVEDNGIGFDEQYLNRIFQPFQRLHGRTEFEGSGIGLAVCRKIAERHAGVLTARSSPEQGATFIVTLPVQQPAQKENKGTSRDGGRFLKEKG
jgi:signal transduction histidine kinase